MHNLPDRDLAYFSEGNAHFNDYVEAVHWAQEYARVNRQEMMKMIVAVLQQQLPPFSLATEAINCHHNYVVREQHFGRDVFVTRKGVQCRKDKGVIDEIPAAYKDIDQVMNNQRDLVDVVHTLRQVICIKG